jgi:diketogulonate reductase-like aldo/keto reductase
METIILNNSVEMPALGLGVFQTPADETRDAVHSALGTGYRLIDTAAAYGNERQVGEAIHGAEVARSEVFLETKVWISDYGYEETLHAFEKSARKLGVDQIDLLILHQALPSAFDRTLEAYRALETLLADGKVRAIGVSNFMVEHLTRLLECATVVPAINQIEVHPTSRSVRCRSSAPSTASSRRLGHRSAASPSTATVAAAAPSTTRASETSPGLTARLRRR